MCPVFGVHYTVSYINFILDKHNRTLRKKIDEIVLSKINGLGFSSINYIKDFFPFKNPGMLISPVNIKDYIEYILGLDLAILEEKIVEISLADFTSHQNNLTIFKNEYEEFLHLYGEQITAEYIGNTYELYYLIDNLWSRNKYIIRFSNNSKLKQLASGFVYFTKIEYIEILLKVIISIKELLIKTDYLDKRIIY